ncbi:MAG: hypothetical protein JNL30_18010 [Rubrivivax sp.]|nr:hypothetical protein [Rubrivivax sp.]
MPATHLQDGAVEAAFASVLQAEQAAREAITAAHTEAATRAEAARADSRARAERARRHLAAVRAAFERRRDDELAGLAAQAEALNVDAPLTEADRAHVERAVLAVAAQLTGGAQ